jgi:hypothetical protein
VNLVIASGIAGKTWARGASLEEQSGQVSVNGVQVFITNEKEKKKIGLVFNPSWTKSNIVSEELPLYAMHTYAETILDSFKPFKSLPTERRTRRMVSLLQLSERLQWFLDLDL